MTLPAPNPIAHCALFRAAHPDYIPVYVEGATDLEFWKPRLRWKPLAAGGRDAVLSAVKTLRVNAVGPCLGIVDADLDRLLGSSCESEDVLLSESHDLECDLLRSAVLERLLACAGTNDNLPSTQQVRELLVANSAEYGLLRWHFRRTGNAWPDSRMSPYRFVDKQSLSTDVQSLHREAASLLGVSVFDLTEQVTQLRAACLDIWQVCNGHDAIAVLTLVLQRIFQCTKTFPSDRVVSTAVRLAVGSEHLPELTVWSAIEQWEKRNVVNIRRGAGSTSCLAP